MYHIHLAHINIELESQGKSCFNEICNQGYEELIKYFTTTYTGQGRLGTEEIMRRNIKVSKVGNSTSFSN